MALAHYVRAGAGFAIAVPGNFYKRFFCGIPNREIFVPRHRQEEHGLKLTVIGGRHLAEIAENRPVLILNERRRLHAFSKPNSATSRITPTATTQIAAIGLNRGSTVTATAIAIIATTAERCQRFIIETDMATYHGMPTGQPPK